MIESLKYRKVNYITNKSMSQDRKIDIDSTFSIVCKIGIIFIGVVVLFMIFKWCRSRYFHNSLSQGNSQQNNGIPPPSLQLFGRSRSETIAINAFANILYEKGYDWQKIVVGYRPDYIRNPKTGRSLEIDAYYPDLKLGIEYNGIQHYKFPNHIHMDTPIGQKDFDEGIERDKFKKLIAKENGVRIIDIPYYIDTCIPCKIIPTNWLFRKNTDLEKFELIRIYLRQKMIEVPSK